MVDIAKASHLSNQRTAVTLSAAAFHSVLVGWSELSVVKPSLHSRFVFALQQQQLLKVALMAGVTVQSEAPLC